MPKRLTLLRVLSQFPISSSACECLALAQGDRSVAADIERQRLMWDETEQALGIRGQEQTAYLLPEWEAESLSLMQRLAGCDEVGRGPLAGPLVTAAVILPYGTYIPGLRDSKMLSHEERLAMIPWIKAAALAYAITEISLEELNSPAANINSLSLEGMTRSLKALSLVPSCAVVDGRYRLPSWNGPQKALIKGDNRCPVVAAASVLAKVHRDLIMIEADRRWPQYGFAENKGYGTARHLRALQEYGPCPWHRRHYRPISALLGDSPDAE